MAVSKFDKMILDGEEQNKIENSTVGYDESLPPEVKASYHNLAEEVRRENGYSGGLSGDTYIPIDTFNAPNAPQIDPYKSRWDNEIEYYRNMLKNPNEYSSPYSDKIDDLLNVIDAGSKYIPKYQKYIDQGLSDMINLHPYEYDPDTDASYQRFLENVEGASEQAYQDSMERMASTNAGYVSSFAEEIARKASDEMNTMAQNSVEAFDDLAYSKYQFETEDTFRRLNTTVGLENQSIDQFKATQGNRFSLLQAIQKQDEIGYMRFRNNIDDVKWLAQTVLELDQVDFERYKYTSDLAYKNFYAELDNLKGEMNFKQEEWRRAMETVELNGFVGNNESFVLGVPIGTPAKSARERVEEMEYFKLQQDKLLEVKKKKIDFQFQQDKEIAGITYQYAIEQLGARYDGAEALERLKEDISIQASNLKRLAGGGTEEDVLSGMMGLSTKEKDIASQFVFEVQKQIDKINDSDATYYEKQEMFVDLYNNTHKSLSEVAESGSWGDNSTFIVASALDSINQIDDFINSRIEVAKREELAKTMVERLAPRKDGGIKPFRFFDFEFDGDSNRTGMKLNSDFLETNRATTERYKNAENTILDEMEAIYHKNANKKKVGTEKKSEAKKEVDDLAKNYEKIKGGGK